MKTKNKLLMLLGLMIFHRKHLTFCIESDISIHSGTHLYLVKKKNPNNKKPEYPGNLSNDYLIIISGFMSESKMESLAYCYNINSFPLCAFLGEGACVWIMCTLLDSRKGNILGAKLPAASVLCVGCALSGLSGPAGIWVNTIQSDPHFTAVHSRGSGPGKVMTLRMRSFISFLQSQ